MAGRPFLDYVLANLRAQGVRHGVLSVGYLADKVISHFGRRFGDVEIDYEVEDRPLGTGGAIAAALQHCRADPVLVLNGDTYLSLDLAALAAQWQKSARPVIVARRVPDVARYGSLQVQDGRVRCFAEKGASGPGLTNAGAYLLPRDSFGAAPPASPFSIEADFLAGYVRRAPTDAFVTDGAFIDIGVPDDYRRAQALAADWPAPGPVTGPSQASQWRQFPGGNSRRT